MTTTCEVMRGENAPKLIGSLDVLIRPRLPVYKHLGLNRIASHKNAAGSIGRYSCHAEVGCDTVETLLGGVLPRISCSKIRRLRQNYRRLQGISRRALHRLHLHSGFGNCLGRDVYATGRAVCIISSMGHSRCLLSSTRMRENIAAHHIFCLSLVR